MEVNWPVVRQIILNDRLNGYKPDRKCLMKISSFLPDVKFLGFGRYYAFHWYVLVETKYFPESIEPLSIRGTIPLTAVIKDLANRNAL